MSRPIVVPFVPFAVLVMGLALMPRAFAQQTKFTSAAPPLLSNPVRIAQGAIGKMGLSLEGEPSRVSNSKDSTTGHRLIEMEWKVSSDSGVNYIAMTLDQETGQITAFSDGAASKASFVDAEAGKPVTVTENEAKAKLESVMEVAGVSPGDWAFEPAELRRYGGANDRQGNFYWTVIKRRLVGGLSVGHGFFSVTVDPYGGRITHWDYVDDAVVIPPVRPIFTAAQLEPLAIKAFEEYAAPILRPGDSHIPEHSPKRPHWRSLSDDSPLCRLQYVFSFYLTFVDDPTREARVAKDPNDAYWYGRAARTIWVEMDAETGEILFVATPSGGGGAGLAYNGCSAHVGMMYTMLEIKPADALALALIGGFPLKTRTAPDPKDKSVVRLHRAIGGKTYYFAFAPKTKRLFWQRGGGKIPAGWAGVSLSDERAAALSLLLKGKGSPH